MRQMLACAAVLFLVLGALGCSDGGGETADVTTDPGVTDLGPSDLGPTDPGPTDPGPGESDIVPDVPDIPPVDVCAPDCGTKKCGLDSCGGLTCGSCDTGFHCLEPAGTCEKNGATPTQFGPAGYVSALQTPADPAVAKTTCVDFTADGLGDSSLVNLAGQLNGPLNDAIKSGDIGILFEFGPAETPVADFANTASFHLIGLLGEPIDKADFSQQYVSPDGFDPATGDPLISFAGAKITASALAAGPSKFQLTIPVQGVPLTLTLNAATLKGVIDADSSATAGVSLKQGVLAGIITKDEVDKVIADLQATCDAAPSDAKPSYCQYLTVVKGAEALLFTLHDNGDGTYVPKSKDAPGNAAAACFTYELSKATKLEPKPAL